MIFRKDTGGSTYDLLDLLHENGVFISAACGGNGKCGKCRVRFTKGAPKAGEHDLQVLTEKEIEDGWRLACHAQVSGEFAVEIETAEDEILVETGFSKNTGIREKSPETGEASLYKAAVDIGTTTIAASRVNTETGEAEETVTSVNHQRSFGADVISRIQASNEGSGEKLRESIENDLHVMMEKLGLDPEKTETVISGNTTMEHLLQGLSCKSLGVAPYTPVDISLHKYKNMTILPGVSTYVGADIVSGIIACGMDEKEGICVLMDLGTNGEMAIGNRERILVTSTAAGPAFEGGCISCGVAGIPGAIDTVTIKDGEVSYTTIGGKKPVGLCGTGVLETMYELLINEIVDETGLMDDEYTDDGYPVAENVVFTDKDVREIQLAKAAVRAGLETLIEEYGTDYDGIESVFIAGGFGRKINMEKAAGIGLLPKELLSKCIAVGNSSLEGAVRFAAGPSLADRFMKTASGSVEVSLADSAAFNEYYMDQMFFPEV